MSAAANRMLIVVLAMALSCGTWFGSLFTSHIFVSSYKSPWEKVSALLPMLTKLAVDLDWIYILAVCCFAALALVLSAFRGSSAFANFFGIGLPLLIGWFVLFSLTYSAFLGSVSMHHPQWFEWDQFLFSYFGLYPCSLLLIVGLTGMLARDALRGRPGTVATLPG